MGRLLHGYDFIKLYWGGFNFKGTWYVQEIKFKILENNRGNRNMKIIMEVNIDLENGKREMNIRSNKQIDKEIAYRLLTNCLEEMKEEELKNARLDN